MPELSIVVPVHNCESFIIRCIESIYTQKGCSIEVFLVDDGSTDASGMICDSLVFDDDRFSVLHTQNNGVSVARNIGLGYATSPYVMFVDGDDWLETDCVRHALNEISLRSADILIGDYYGEFAFESKPDSFFDLESSKPCFSDDEKEVLIRNCIVADGFGKRGATANVGVPWAKIYRTDFLRSNGLMFKPGLRRMQDTIFNMQCMHSAGIICYYAKPLYHYRKTNQSATTAYDPSFAETAEEILIEIDRFIDKNNARWLQRDRQTKAVSLFFEWVRLSVVPPDNGLTLKEKAAMVKGLAMTEKYFYAIRGCEENKLSRMARLGRGLCLLHAWESLVILFSLHAMSKRRQLG